MKTSDKWDVIIVGGSYAGLSAAMALGRSLRNVLIVDSGAPCNRQTPHSHNFITHDGQKPQLIADTAKEQVLHYNTVRFYQGLAVNGGKIQTGFEIETASGDVFQANKLIFASGIRDLIPAAITGFSDCWGISVLHCPYCHGYEVRDQETGILANGEMAAEFVKLISNWTDQLTLFTNGSCTLTEEQIHVILSKGIRIEEAFIDSLDHKQGYIQQVHLRDGRSIPLTALYARIPFEQHCEIPLQLGCEVTEQGHLKVDQLSKTNVQGVFACGDNSSSMRAISHAVAMGTIAGAIVNMELIDEIY